jgi:pyruvate dehydrogenase E1 component beta subunit
MITYREAVARGIAQEMRRDESVVFLGEDVAAAGGVFKATVGLLEEFGPQRVRDTPISEQAILGAAMGAAMTGLRPVAEIMFSDFFAVCWDLVANEIAKSRYMSDGQVSFPLVIRCANGGGVRFGAQHSQSVENWAMAVPGLKVVAPSNPQDVIGLLAAAIRDPDPVLFFEHKSLYATKGDVDDGEIVDELGRATVLREGRDATMLALGAMVRRATQAAGLLAAEHGIDCSVVDVRSLVPLTPPRSSAEVAKLQAVHGGGEPAAVRVGRGDRLDRRGRSVRRADRAAGADHHPAHSASRRRRARRPRAAVRGADHADGAGDIGGRVSADLAALTGIDVPTGLFIDGEWTGNGRTLGVTDPATEDTLV